MRHFVVEIIYKAPIEKIEELTPTHREFLQTGYNAGMLLVSGPKVPRTGGIVIAKASSLEELTEFFKSDPYALNDAADYRFIEFNPKSHQEILKDWLE
ncbi:MAG: YciI family protein [Ignavibacteria bacterium]|nr:YciI family protein [Ignavibacteria bacterium]